MLALSFMRAAPVFRPTASNCHVPDALWNAVHGQGLFQRPVGVPECVPQPRLTRPHIQGRPLQIGPVPPARADLILVRSFSRVVARVCLAGYLDPDMLLGLP